MGAPAFMPPVMSHHPVPRPVDVVNRKAARDVQEAQAALALGFDRAQRELRLVGIAPEASPQLIRIVALAVLSAFDGETVTADRALLALVDRLERERWLQAL
jgi:hypothetical protein